MNKEKYILMFKDYRVLSFTVSTEDKTEFRVLEKLERFDLAPYGMKQDASIEELSNYFLVFFNRRSLAQQRWDYQDILKNTGCSNFVELAFKGHGLSLSNHYWYKKENEDLKYDDINFFTNKWDDSFARAVLSGNYEDLKTANLNVPDITTAGWAIKGWLCEDTPKLCKLGIVKDCSEESISEVLASRLASRLFKKGQYVNYELREINGRYASVSESMINIDEELVPLASALSSDYSAIFALINEDKKNVQLFLNKLLENGYQELYEFFVRLLCFRSLCFLSDLHFGNISVIRNMKTGAIRPAPLYDLAGAFGSTRGGKRILSNVSKSTFLIVYYLFCNLDPNWDYSWYNSDNLIGFEDEIREFLSKSDFYTPELIDNIVEVYKHQKSFLDEMKQNQISKKN